MIYESPDMEVVTLKVEGGVCLSGDQQLDGSSFEPWETDGDLWN